MNSRILGVLLAGGVALTIALRWFYEGLLYDAIIAKLKSWGVPEANLFASIPPFIVSAAIVWGMYAMLRAEMDRKYGAKSLPDTPIADALDYIVNDTNTPLKQPPPPEIERTNKRENPYL